MAEWRQIPGALRLINEHNSQPVRIHGDDVWNAWPAFVDECYGGNHPERFDEADKVLNDFMHWMITSKNHEFYRVVGDKKGTDWLRNVAEIDVKRRILEWKLRQYIEHGIDLFATPEIRDELVEKLRTGEFVFW